MSAFEPPDTIYGIDFSAAKRDAGRNTWLAKARVGGGRLVVECLKDASAFLDCSPGRESTHRALVEAIREGANEQAAFGLDFPFGLPEAFLREGQDWRGFVADVSDSNRWGTLGTVEDPDALYRQADESGHVRDDERSRTTDLKHGGQSPAGFRIRSQTFYGISSVLAEVVDHVSVLPMDDPRGDTLVLETYPAGTFRSLRDRTDGRGPHDTGYKRDTFESIERRRVNVEALVDVGVDLGGHCRFAGATDDALDAVAAAYATWRATRTPVEADEVPGAARREGYIFV